MEKVYSSDFYAYNNAVALASARGVIPILAEYLSPTSVLDVGCGVGAWCSVWRENGVPLVMGVDGEYVERGRLLIEEDLFTPANLSKPFSAGRTFDLVMSLEVAEHVPEALSDTFVDNLVRHGKMVLFSAAVKGQGGEFHVNEQPLEYWREKFLERGYQCFDPVRAAIRDRGDIAPWYRFNTLLYVENSVVDDLPGGVRSARVLPGSRIPNVSPLWWSARNQLLGLLPRAVTDFMARSRSVWVRRRNANR